MPLQMSTVGWLKSHPMRTPLDPRGARGAREKRTLELRLSARLCTMPIVAVSSMKPSSTWTFRGVCRKHFLHTALQFQFALAPCRASPPRPRRKVQESFLIFRFGLKTLDSGCERLSFLDLAPIPRSFVVKLSLRTATGPSPTTLPMAYPKMPAFCRYRLAMPEDS
jgi:hypothetical protein